MSWDIIHANYLRYMILFYFQIYKFKDIAQLCELPNAFMIGAGAGPAHIVGINSEVLWLTIDIIIYSIYSFNVELHTLHVPVTRNCTISESNKQNRRKLPIYTRHCHTICTVRSLTVAIILIKLYRIWIIYCVLPVCNTPGHDYMYVHSEYLLTCS